MILYKNKNSSHSQYPLWFFHPRFIQSVEYDTKELRVKMDQGISEMMPVP